jgi:hypothetical protein
MKRPRLIGPWSLRLVDDAVRGGMPRKQGISSDYGAPSLPMLSPNRLQISWSPSSCTCALSSLTDVTRPESMQTKSHGADHA